MFIEHFYLALPHVTDDLKRQVYFMKYIAHGSKSQNDSKDLIHFESSHIQAGRNVASFSLNFIKNKF